MVSPLNRPRERGGEAIYPTWIYSLPACCPTFPLPHRHTRSQMSVYIADVCCFFFLYSFFFLKNVGGRVVSSDCFPFVASHQLGVSRLSSLVKWIIPLLLFLILFLRLSLSVLLDPCPFLLLTNLQTTVFPHLPNPLLYHLPPPTRPYCNAVVACSRIPNPVWNPIVPWETIRF